MKPVRMLIALAILTGGNFGCQLMTKDGFKAWSAARASKPALTSEGFEDSAPADPVRQKFGLLQAKATLAEADGNYPEAIRSYEAILQAAPDEVSALHKLAILHTQHGDQSRAEQSFRSALKLAVDDAQLHNDFGYFCHLHQRSDEALDHLTRAVTMAPEMREAHNNLGLVYARLGRCAEAENHFRLAGCSRAETLNNLAFGRMMERDFDDATAIYQLALKSDPNQATARNALQKLDRHTSSVLQPKTPPASIAANR